MITPPRWSYISASVRGADHDKTGQPCQDAHAIQILRRNTKDELLVAVVSDGAGSAQHAEAGAKLAVATALQMLSEVRPNGPSSPAGLASAIITRTQHAIATEAERLGAHVRDFACTLLAAFVGPDWSFFLQHGDGAIIVSRPGEGGDYAWVFWPDKGEYANQTSFVTDVDASATVMADGGPGNIDEIALFTDGLERLALDFLQQIPHRPFFEPLFSHVREAALALDQRASDEMSEELARFLDSPRINERTGDDKTLIIASRRRTE